MRYLAVTVALLLMFPLLGAGQEAEKSLLLPGGGLADPAGKVGFWPARDKGIDAVDLETGQVLWHTKAAGKPLLATKDTLIAQSDVANKPNQVRVVVLATTDKGKKVLESQPVIFPDWVSVTAQHGRTFHSMARADDNSIQLIWEARAFYAGGAAPTREILEAARRHAVGVMRIDAQTGKVSSVKDANPKPVWKEVPSAKLAARMFTMVEKPAEDPNNPLQQRRFVQAVDQAGKVFWQHEIAAPRALIPPP